MGKRGSRRTSKAGLAAAIGVVTAAGAATAVVAARRRAEAEAPDLVEVDRLDLVSHDGTRLAVWHRHPATDPIGRVVLAHGWVMSSAFWSAAAERLVADGFEVITWDQRGHGQSEAPRHRSGYEFRQLGRDLDVILDTLATDELPLLLVGHSMGAMTILSWAQYASATTEHQPTAAVLCNTAFHGLVADALAGITHINRPGPLRAIQAGLHAPIPIPRSVAIRPLVRHFAHSPGAHPDAVRLTHSLSEATPTRVRSSFSGSLSTLDLRAGVAALTVPTLVVIGDHDILTPPEHGRRLARDLPNGRLLELRGAGHQAPIEHPDGLHRIMTDHLRAVLAGEVVASVATAAAS